MVSVGPAVALSPLPPPPPCWVDAARSLLVPHDPQADMGSLLPLGHFQAWRDGFVSFAWIDGGLARHVVQHCPTGAYLKVDSPPDMPTLIGEALFGMLASEAPASLPAMDSRLRAMGAATRSGGAEDWGRCVCDVTGQR